MKNLKHFFTKAITMLMTLTLLMGMASAPAMAAGEYTVGANDTNATVTMNKYLLMDAEATVPTVAFTFSIAPGTAATITVAGQTQKVLAGIMGGSVGNAAFAPGQADMTVLTTLADADKADIGTTMPDGKKYAKQTTSISLAGITFPAPGVYRYVITETGMTPAAVPGVSMDENTTRILDVYVGYKDETDQASQMLSIIGTVLHNGTSDTFEAIVPGGPETHYVGKKTGFTNDYGTIDLILTKTVAGNQGYRSQYFPFKITLGGAGVKGDFSITRSDGTAIDTTAEIPGFEPAKNPGTITAGTEATVYLKHGENIKINGLPKGATYTITEDKTSCGDYTTTITDSNGGDVKVPTVTGTMNAADANVAYTNTREGTIPTGILLDIWPYMLIVAVAAAALIALMAKKRKRAARD